MTAPAIAAGFANPVHGAQTVFRTLLNAMARPGSVAEVPITISAPSPLTPSLAALALTLLDEDTPTWLDGDLDCDTVRNYLRLHTGVLLVTAPGTAMFAFVGRPSALPALQEFCAGDVYQPHRSTTVLLEVPALVGGTAVAFTGPGIETNVAIAPQGLSSAFWTDWNENATRYPAGIDLVLAAGRQFCCLPRTARSV